MHVHSGKVVTIDFVLKNSAGDIIDSTDDGEFVYLHGASNIIPGLEREMEGKSIGDVFTAKIAPEDGYGPRDDRLVQVVSRDTFEEGAEVILGMQFHAQSEKGDPMIITITDIQGDRITIDGNHSLAGEELFFDVKILDIREATEDEVSHGHAHGEEDYH